MKNNSKIADIKRRFANAKKRARYWAGLPSFSEGGGHSMSRLSQQRRAARGTDHEMEYEMAMSDCESLASEIAKMTGKKPVVVDFKKRFRDSFSSSFVKAS